MAIVKHRTNHEFPPLHLIPIKPWIGFQSGYVRDISCISLNSSVLLSMSIRMDM